jgi:hypothetical protein
MKRCILFLTIVILALSLCACSDSVREDTGGDTDIGGMFWDILHGIRGDKSSNMEFENNDTTETVLPEEITKQSGNGLISW